jgi:hypothetical protein
VYCTGAGSWTTEEYSTTTLDADDDSFAKWVLTDLFLCPQHISVYHLFFSLFFAS